MKNNYGVLGGKFDLEWKNGLFVPIITGLQSDIDQAATDKLFLELLDQFTREGRNVTLTTGRSYAPAQFADHADAKGISKLAFKASLDRLLKSKIKNHEYGPPSTRRSKLVLKQED